MTKFLHKVRVIEADLSNPIQAMTERDQLGRQIAALARQVNEPVLFHDYKGPVGGAPVILLECSDRFLAAVRTLPAYRKDHEVQPDLDTERSPRVQAYFMLGAMPRRPAPPKP